MFAKYFQVLLIFQKSLGDRFIYPQGIFEYEAQCFENTRFQLESFVLSVV